MSISILLWFFALSGATLLLLLSVTARPLWKARKLLADMSAALYLLGAVYVWSDGLQPILYALMSIVSLFGVVYAARVHVDRLHHYHLRHTTTYGTTILYGISLVLLVIGAVFNSFEWLVAVACFASLGWGSVVIGQLAWAKRNYRRHALTDVLSEKEMPTVTLAIPARNENHALTDCLQSAVASDYPKLEIIVLDDCSQDRTSQLIKSFAHEGVRFVQGKEPSQGWLGKNQAMQTLAEHAHGDYIIFSGVDTRLSRRTITEVISFMVTHHVDMITLMPQRRDLHHPSIYFQQLRYYWQTALPATGTRVPVATSAWGVKTETLQNLGGFGSAKSSIMPEASFAKRLHPTDLYRFSVSDEVVGVSAEKKWSSQVETGLRIIYPICKRQPIVVLGVIAALFALLVPYIYGIWAMVSSEPPEEARILLVGLAVITSIVLSAGYAAYLKLSSPKVWLTGLITFPLLILQELILTVLSMMQYEFGEVNWKGRNVCYPVINPPKAD